ncbi:MAG: sulfatase-like hydrolase/transferase [Bacteroidales bacterium]|nr:sulfatase-like hydrolase/transferase [Bacteroidales bacterium]
MKKILIVSALVIPILLIIFFKETPPDSNPRPNIILILVDDLGYADVGFTGCEDFKTPHIDELAYNGVTCINGYASHAFCAPTRAGILTGRNQHRFGFQFNPNLKNGLGLPEDQVLLPELLSEAGYHSALVGKWHLGLMENHHPLKRGFDDFFGFLNWGHDYFISDSLETNLNSGKLLLEHNGKRVNVEGYLTDQLTDFAVDYIKRQKESPFFLYMAYNAPHTPLQASQEYLQRVNNIEDSLRKVYAAMVVAVDDGVGRITKTLEEEGILDNTLIFFMSDNGGAPVAPANNAPFRGMKGTVLEGGIHVPYVVYWKGKLTQGIYEKPVISYDFFATAVAVAGIDVPNDRKMDSKNLLPYFTGEKSGAPHQHLFWQMGDKQWAVRSETKKAVNISGEPTYLFDMINDGKESKDLSSSAVQNVQSLEHIFYEWRKELPEPLSKSNGISNERQANALEDLGDTR